MEPRHDAPKTPELSSEAPTARPKGRSIGRFSIEPLEERIAPKQVPTTSGDPVPPIVA